MRSLFSIIRVSRQSNTNAVAIYKKFYRITLPSESAIKSARARTRLNSWVSESIFFPFSFSSPFPFVPRITENSWRTQGVGAERRRARAIGIHSGLSRNNHKRSILLHPRAPVSYLRLSCWTASFTSVINNFGAWCHSIIAGPHIRQDYGSLIWMILDYSRYSLLFINLCLYTR